MMDRVFSAVVALSLAFLVWLYARSRDQEILDNVPVPVQVTLAQGQVDEYSLEVQEPAVVPVSFVGSPSRIRELRGMLQRGELRVDMTVTVPVERQGESRYLDTVRVEASDVHAPPGVTPMMVQGRNRIPVTLHHLVERPLPVRFDSGMQERLGQITVEPATVLVRGPEELLDRVKAVPCRWDHEMAAAWEQKYAESSTHLRARTITQEVSLPQELEGRAVRVSPCVVTVSMTLQGQRKIYDLDIPIHFLTPAGFTLRPGFNGNGRDGKVFLSVEGPATEEPPAVLAFIDLTRRKFEAGLHDEPLRLQLPKGFQVVQGPPKLVPFRLDPPEMMPKGTVTSPDP